MIKILVVFSLSLIIVLTCNITFATSVAIEKEYSYQASELDSKVSSRTIALEQVKRLVLEQVGTYVSSTTIVKDYQLSSDQITAITAGVVGVEVENESWDGKTYYIKAKCTVDPDEVPKAIDKVLQNQAQVAELEETKAKMDELLKEVDGLKTQVAALQVQDQDRQGRTGDNLPNGQYYEDNQAPTAGAPQYGTAPPPPPLYGGYPPPPPSYVYGESPQLVQYQAGYADAISQVRALNFVLVGWTYYNAGRYQSALAALNEADAISHARNPRINIARSFVYAGTGYRRRALEELSKAVKLDPRYRRQEYVGRSVYFQQNGDRNRALQEANRAVNHSPNYSYAYYQRAVVHDDLGNKKRARQDMRKAAALGNKRAQYQLRNRPQAQPRPKAARPRNRGQGQQQARR